MQAIPADIDAEDAIIDGEIVVLDERGESHFYDLMFDVAHQSSQHSTYCGSMEKTCGISSYGNARASLKGASVNH